MNCLLCKIRKKAIDEFVDFLNWLSEKEYYEQILGEYSEYQEQLKAKQREG